MGFRRIIVGAVAALLVTTPAMAQPARVELGFFGDYTSFGDASGFESGFGGGTRLGLFLFSRFEIEASVTGGSTDFAPAALLTDAVIYAPVRARLIYNQPITGGLAFLIGGGYSRNQFVVSGTWSDTHAWGGMAGLRLNLSRGFALRVDGDAEILPDLSDVPGSNVNYGVQAGFSFMMGGSGRWGGGGGDDAFGRGQGAFEPVNTQTVRDADRDGVRDERDRCPGTPAGASVDGSGCLPEPMAEPEEPEPQPAAAMEPEEEPAEETMPEAEPVAVEPEPVTTPTPDERSAAAVPTGVLEQVSFPAGWWDLDDGARSALDRVAEALRANPSARIQVIGHTDNTGSRWRNMWLSLYRAEAVKLYLTQQGVEPGRIDTAGYGPLDPIASNSTVEGRAKNRRIEIHEVR